MSKAKGTPNSNSDTKRKLIYTKIKKIIQTNSSEASIRQLILKATETTDHSALDIVNTLSPFLEEAYTENSSSCCHYLSRLMLLGIQQEKTDTSNIRCKTTLTNLSMLHSTSGKNCFYNAKPQQTFTHYNESFKYFISLNMLNIPKKDIETKNQDWLFECASFLIKSEKITIPKEHVDILLSHCSTLLSKNSSNLQPKHPPITQREITQLPHPSFHPDKVVDLLALIFTKLPTTRTRLPELIKPLVNILNNYYIQFIDNDLPLLSSTLAPAYLSLHMNSHILFQLFVDLPLSGKHLFEKKLLEEAQSIIHKINRHFAKIANLVESESLNTEIANNQESAIEEVRLGNQIETLYHLCQYIPRIAPDTQQQIRCYKSLAKHLNSLKDYNHSSFVKERLKQANQTIHNGLYSSYSNKPINLQQKNPNINALQAFQQHKKQENQLSDKQKHYLITGARDLIFSVPQISLSPYREENDNAFYAQLASEMLNNLKVIEACEAYSNSAATETLKTIPPEAKPEEALAQIIAYLQKLSPPSIAPILISCAKNIRETNNLELAEQAYKRILNLCDTPNLYESPEHLKAIAFLGLSEIAQESLDHPKALLHKRAAHTEITKLYIKQNCRLTQQQIDSYVQIAANYNIFDYMENTTRQVLHSTFHDNCTKMFQQHQYEMLVDTSITNITKHLPNSAYYAKALDTLRLTPNAEKTIGLIIDNMHLLSSEVKSNPELGGAILTLILINTRFIIKEKGSLQYLSPLLFFKGISTLLANSEYQNNATPNQNTSNAAKIIHLSHVTQQYKLVHTNFIERAQALLKKTNPLPPREKAFSEYIELYRLLNTNSFNEVRYKAENHPSELTNTEKLIFINNLTHYVPFSSSVENLYQLAQKLCTDEVKIHLAYDSHISDKIVKQLSQKQSATVKIVEHGLTQKKLHQDIFMVIDSLLQAQASEPEIVEDILSHPYIKSSKSPIQVIQSLVDQIKGLPETKYYLLATLKHLLLEKASTSKNTTDRLSNLISLGIICYNMAEGAPTSQKKSTLIAESYHYFFDTSNLDLYHHNAPAHKLMTLNTQTITANLIVQLTNNKELPDTQKALKYLSRIIHQTFIKPNNPFEQKLTNITSDEASFLSLTELLPIIKKISKKHPTFTIDTLPTNDLFTTIFNSISQYVLRVIREKSKSALPPTPLTILLFIYKATIQNLGENTSEKTYQNIEGTKAILNILLDNIINPKADINLLFDPNANPRILLLMAKNLYKALPFITTEKDKKINCYRVLLQYLQAPNSDETLTTERQQLIKNILGSLYKEYTGPIDQGVEAAYLQETSNSEFNIPPLNKVLENCKNTSIFCQKLAYKMLHNINLQERKATNTKSTLYYQICAYIDSPLKSSKNIETISIDTKRAITAVPSLYRLEIAATSATVSYKSNNLPLSKILAEEAIAYCKEPTDSTKSYYYYKALAYEILANIEQKHLNIETSQELTKQAYNSITRVVQPKNYYTVDTDTQLLYLRVAFKYYSQTNRKDLVKTIQYFANNVRKIHITNQNINKIAPHIQEAQNIENIPVELGDLPLKIILDYIPKIPDQKNRQVLAAHLLQTCYLSAVNIPQNQINSLPNDNSLQNLLKFLKAPNLLAERIEPTISVIMQLLNRLDKHSELYQELTNTVQDIILLPFTKNPQDQEFKEYFDQYKSFNSENFNQLITTAQNKIPLSLREKLLLLNHLEHYCHFSRHTEHTYQLIFNLHTPNLSTHIAYDPYTIRRIEEKLFGKQHTTQKGDTYDELKSYHLYKKATQYPNDNTPEGILKIAPKENTLSHMENMIEIARADNRQDVVALTAKAILSILESTHTTSPLITKYYLYLAISAKELGSTEYVEYCQKAIKSLPLSKYSTLLHYPYYLNALSMVSTSKGSNIDDREITSITHHLQAIQESIAKTSGETINTELLAETYKSLELIHKSFPDVTISKNTKLPKFIANIIKIFDSKIINKSNIIKCNNTESSNIFTIYCTSLRILSKHPKLKEYTSLVHKTLTNTLESLDITALSIHGRISVCQELYKTTTVLEESTEQQIQLYDRIIELYSSADIYPYLTREQKKQINTIQESVDKLQSNTQEITPPEVAKTPTPYTNQNKDTATDSQGQKNRTEENTTETYIKGAAKPRGFGKKKPQNQNTPQDHPKATNVNIKQTPKTQNNSKSNKESLTKTSHQQPKAPKERTRQPTGYTPPNIDWINQTGKPSVEEKDLRDKNSAISITDHTPTGKSEKKLTQKEETKASMEKPIIEHMKDCIVALNTSVKEYKEDHSNKSNKRIVLGLITLFFIYHDEFRKDKQNPHIFATISNPKWCQHEIIRAIFVHLSHLIDDKHLEKFANGLISQIPISLLENIKHNKSFRPVTLITTNLYTNLSQAAQDNVLTKHEPSTIPSDKILINITIELEYLNQASKTLDKYPDSLTHLASVLHSVLVIEEDWWRLPKHMKTNFPKLNSLIIGTRHELSHIDYEQPKKSSPSEQPDTIYTQQSKGLNHDVLLGKAHKISESLTQALSKMEENLQTKQREVSH